MSEGSSGNKPSRPNPERELTENRPGEDEMVFYYSREKRLAKAPQRVRDLYEKSAQPKFNLLRPLTATKPLATLFATVLILSAISAIVAFSGITGRSYKFQGNSITVEAQRYQGTVIVTVRKKPDPEARTAKGGGLTDILISPAGERGGESSGFSHRIVFSPGKEEEFRMVAPFDSRELIFHIQGESELLEFRVKTR
ncbi:MAG: hypothetical protein LBR93_05820 [Treponema sp.]|jgi:hypothetical protein|nr:hypothetical protein [Treponema sp.]